MASTNADTRSCSGDWTMVVDEYRCELERTDWNLLNADWHPRRSPVRWIPRESMVQNVMQRFERLQLYPIFSGHAFRVGGSKK